MRRTAIFLLLGVSVANAAPRPLERFFNRLDLDNDELLSPAELLRVTRHLDGNFEEATSAVHAWYDADSSGGIDFGEWQDGRRGDLTPPDLTGPASFELDSNGNGKVSGAEFWRVIPKFVPPAVTRKWYAAQFPGGEVTGSVDWNMGGSLWIGGSGGLSVVGDLPTWGAGTLVIVGLIDAPLGGSGAIGSATTVTNGVLQPGNGVTLVGGGTLTLNPGGGTLGNYSGLALDPGIWTLDPNTPLFTFTGDLLNPTAPEESSAAPPVP